LALIDEQASAIMDTQNMYIALYNAQTDYVRFPLMRVNGESQEVTPRSGGHGRTEWIIENKEPIFISTKAESKAWYKESGREEYIGQAFASWIGVPMVAGEEVIGVIAAYHEEAEHLYSEDDLEILRLMADQAAIALKSAQQLDIMRSLAVDLSAGTLDV
jgi:GAF domain-containing protein